MLFIYHCPFCGNDVLLRPAESCGGMLHHAGPPCRAAERYSRVNGLDANSIPHEMGLRSYLSAEMVVSVYQLAMEAEWSGEAYGQGKLSVTRHLRILEEQ